MAPGLSSGTVSFRSVKLGFDSNKLSEAGEDYPEV